MSDQYAASNLHSICSHYGVQCSDWRFVCIFKGFALSSSNQFCLRLSHEMNTEHAIATQTQIITATHKKNTIFWHSDDDVVCVYLLRLKMF